MARSLFSLNLGYQRRLSKVTQQYMADHTGVTRSSYQRYESGIREPDTDTILKIAEALKIPVGELFSKENLAYKEQMLAKR